MVQALDPCIKPLGQALQFMVTFMDNIADVSCHLGASAHHSADSILCMHRPTPATV